SQFSEEKLDWQQAGERAKQDLIVARLQKAGLQEESAIMLATLKDEEVDQLIATYRQGQPAAEQNAAQEEQSQTAEQQANQGQETSNTRIDRLDGVLNGMLHVKQAAALHDYNGDQKVDLNEFLGEGRQQGKHSDLVQED